MFQAVLNEELIGKNHNIFRHPSTKDSFFEELWGTITKGDIWKGEHLNLKKDGTEFWVENSITPNFDDKKEIEYWETRMAGTFTLEFYGEKCNKNHIDFINLIRCQESIEAQNKYEIVLFDPRNTNNLKQFTNSKTFDRYEVEVVIQYFIRSAIDRKRIDTADINYLIELYQMGI